MPDKRFHRGPHPQDAQLFAAGQWPRLRRAVADLSWLLSRGYAEVASLKLVGDRYALTARQRVAVRRCACSDEALRDRLARQVDAAAARGRAVQIDGFNLVTTIEAGLAGGVLLIGRDGAVRDMASMHGSYRKVAETQQAATQIGQTLDSLGIAAAHWLLDRPVSNSGQLRRLLLELAGRHGWAWRVDCVDDSDAALIAAEALVVSADSVVLDRCGAWLNLVGIMLQSGRLAATPPVDLREAV